MLIVDWRFLIGYLFKLDALKDNLLFIRTWYWLFDFLIFSSISRGSDWLEVCDITEFLLLKMLKNDCIRLEKHFLISLSLVEFFTSRNNWSSECLVVRNFDLLSKIPIWKIAVVIFLSRSASYSKVFSIALSPAINEALCDLLLSKDNSANLLKVKIVCPEYPLILKFNCSISLQNRSNTSCFGWSLIG